MSELFIEEVVLMHCDAAHESSVRPVSIERISGQLNSDSLYILSLYLYDLRGSYLADNIMMIFS